MNQMKGVAFVVAMTAIVALFVGSINQEHITFASKGEHISNKGINLQTSTTQDQGCEGAGGTSGITNACTATSSLGTPTSVVLTFGDCLEPNQVSFSCINPRSPNFCNNLDCISISCVGSILGVSNCTTDNGVQLTSCTGGTTTIVTCTRTEPGTGITNSGGITGG